MNIFARVQWTQADGSQFILDGILKKERLYNTKNKKMYLTLRSDTLILKTASTIEELEDL